LARLETAEESGPASVLDIVMDIGDEDPKGTVLRFEAHHPRFLGRVVTFSRCDGVALETHFEVGPFGTRIVFCEAG